MFRSLQKLSWKQCLKETEKKFKYAVGHIYVSEIKHNRDINKDVATVENMIDNIKNSLMEMIRTSSWMDNSTKVRTC